MSNITFSFPLQEVTESASQLVSTLSNLSVETKTSILVPLLVGASYTIYKENKNHHEKLHGLFNLTWKNSSSIKPDEILGNRPFNEYYYVRAEDEKVRDSLEKEKKVLIVGSPLAGKTRMVYEALKNSKKYSIVIPRAKDIDIESFFLPKQLKAWKPKLMFIDDLHRFVELQNFEYIFEICQKNNINLIVTCRSGIEYEKTKKMMLDKNINLETEIFEEIIEIKEFPEKQGKEVAGKVRRNWSETRFNKTIGSIFMPLAEMHKRFIECTPEEKSILKAIKKLYICGVYDEDQIFQLDQIQIVSEDEGVKKEKYQWEELVKNLCDKEFIKREINKTYRVWAEEVYLEDIVKINSPELYVFEELISNFEQNPKASLKIGEKAYLIGYVKLDRAKYMKRAIEAYQNALRTITMEESSIDYTITQLYIGDAYNQLANIEDINQNCKNSIEAYQKALEAKNIPQSSFKYAKIQNCIGAAYGKMAEVEDRAQNCQKAIEAFQKALEIITKEQFSIDYAGIQINIGNTFRILADVEGRTQNCQKAIEAFQKALEIKNAEQYPIEYAHIQNCIGTVYGTLANVEDKAQKAQNCKKAIEAFQNSLNFTLLEYFNTMEQYQIDCAMIHMNIGIVYKLLSEVEDTVQNCKKAIEAFQKALETFTEEINPKDNKIILDELSDLHSFLKINNIEI